MNLATGTLDRLRGPQDRSLVTLAEAERMVSKARAEVRREARDSSVVSAYYTSTGSAGVAPEKEYWQLCEAYKSWVYTCIDKIAKSVAMVPLQLFIYRSKQTGKVIRDISWKSVYRGLKTSQERQYFLKELKLTREEIFVHPLLELIQKPNAFMTRMLLWYNTIIRLELNGLCGWLKVRDKLGLGVTRQIYPLPLTKFGGLRAKVLPDVTLEYWEYRDGNVERHFKQDEIVPFLYANPVSPFQGMSALMAQTYPYDIDLYLMQQQKAFFEHGATPGLHLTTDQNLSQDQVDEMREQINEQYGGSLKSGETLITHSGLKASAIGQTSRQAMIDEVARFSRDKLITSFDLSPGKVGLVEDVNRANMAGLDRIFIHECLRPKCLLIEESVEAFFLPDYDKGLTCDFALPSTEDEEFELKAMETRLRMKVTTVDQEREKLGQDPVDWGHRPWGSFTDVQIGKGGSIPLLAPASPPEKSKGVRRKLMDLAFWTEEKKVVQWKAFVARGEELEQMIFVPISQHFREQCEEVLKRLDKEGKKVLGQYAGWSRQRVRQHLKECKAVNLRAINIDEKEEREFLAEKFSPIVLLIMKERGDDKVRELSNTVKDVTIEFNVNDPRVLKWLGARMRRFSREVAGTTFGEIEAILKEGFSEGEPIVTIADTLRSKFDGWEQYRAASIARTETMASMNEADRESVKQLGLEDALRKHWLSARDGACRDTHLEADKRYSENGIGIDEEFEVGRDRMQMPLGGSLAEENINCRCTTFMTQVEEGEG